MGEQSKKTISPDQTAALERLIAVARRDTGQSRRVADFLLAWWNAGECGGFDLTDLWSVDTGIARDMVEVVILIARQHEYPDTLGYSKQFEELVRLWRSTGSRSERPTRETTAFDETGPDDSTGVDKYTCL